VKPGELVGTHAGHGDPPGHGHTAPAAADRGWPDPQALDGPFTTRQLLRLDQSLRYADQRTGLVFSVYVGDLDEPVREHAARLHGQLPDPDRGVLLAVSPQQRVLEIVTGPVARRRLPDRDCGLAALSMTTAFAGGDLTGGIVTGLTQLADRAAEL
jgi:uncharacterized membrane protein YgcG